MRIAFLTESRADWGGIRPVFHEAMYRGIEVKLCTYDINLWSPPDDVCHSFLAGMDVDWFVFLGDRPNVLRSIIFLLERRKDVGIAHLSGGDKQAGPLIDEPCRHAISKFAHVHFPCTQQSAERLIRQGEDPKRIHIVGSTMVDELLNFHPVIRLDHRAYTVILMHPSPDWTEYLYCLKSYYRDSKVYFLQPNNDKGFGDTPKDIEFVGNLQREEFLNLIWNCSEFVGNSSAMYLEAQYLGVPCLHLGKRNCGREEAFPGHIISCPDMIAYGIYEKATKVSIMHDARCSTDSVRDNFLRADWQKGAHGNGTASKQILDILSDIGKPIPRFLRKEWL